MKVGAKRLAQVILGASHLVQCAIPACLTPKTPKERESMIQFKANLKCQLEHQAMFFYKAINGKHKKKKCPGLTVLQPQGAMYAMVQVDLTKFDTTLIHDDISFTKFLLEEENVFVLPGQAFAMPSYSSKEGTTRKIVQDGSHTNEKHGNTCVFRVVFCAPQDTLEEAANRIFSFCLRHQAIEM